TASGVRGIYQSDDAVQQSASRYSGRRGIYGSDPVVFCISWYPAGAGINRDDSAFKCGLRPFRTKHRYLYYRSTCIHRNKGERKTYYSHPSDVQYYRYNHFYDHMYGNTICVADRVDHTGRSGGADRKCTYHIQYRDNSDLTAVWHLYGTCSGEDPSGQQERRR